MRRHLFDVARILRPLVSRQPILLSSGISNAMHTRGPYDVANLADVLQLNQTTGGARCISKLPSSLVTAAEGRHPGCLRRAESENP